jgi:hypothetical protein
MPQERQAAMSAAEIENIFIGITSALLVRIRIDEIIASFDGNEFIIHSHDSYGRLPDLRAAFAKDSENLDDISIKVAQLCMAVRLRQEIVDRHRGCRFLPPAYKKKRALAAIRVRGKTIAAQGRDYCHAYQELIRTAENIESVGPAYPSPCL